MISEMQAKDETFYKEVFVDAEEMSARTKITPIDSKINDKEDPKTRKNLPAPFSSNSKVSLWTVLKSLIGKILNRPRSDSFYFACILQ